MSKVLSAVAWPYANGPRHIGHIAGFGVPSDVFSRYMRMAGHDVLMVSGTDEHGTKVAQAAEERGLTPQQHVDQLAPRFKELARRLNAKVNLIPYNPVPGLPFRTPSPAATAQFVKILTDGGLNVNIRYRKGDRISAACGQLRRRGIRD